MAVLAGEEMEPAKWGYGQYRQWRGEVANPGQWLPPIIDKEPQESP
jgi:hypothetical protein